MKSNKVLLIILVAFNLSSCSTEQLKQGMYYSIHEKQRQDCLLSGQKDCSEYEYDRYDEYQRRKKQDETR